MSYQAVDWVLRHATVKGVPWQVLVVMADAADDQGRNSFKSKRTIAALANVDPKQVQKAWRLLEAEGYIAVDGTSPMGTCRWRVLMPADHPAKPLPDSARNLRTADPGSLTTPGAHATRGQNNSGPGVKSARDPGSLTTPKQPIENNPSERERAHANARSFDRFNEGVV